MVNVHPPFQALCIDASGRPNELPESKWLEAGKEYTVTKITKHLNQDGMYSFTLKEIDLTDFQPFIGFMCTRFMVLIPS